MGERDSGRSRRKGRKNASHLEMKENREKMRDQYHANDMLLQSIKAQKTDRPLPDDMSFLL